MNRNVGKTSDEMERNDRRKESVETQHQCQVSLSLRSSPACTWGTSYWTGYVWTDRKRNSASGERWTVANQQLELAELAAASALAQFAAEPEPEPAAEHTKNAAARGDNEAAWLKYVRGDNKWKCRQQQE